MRRTIVGLAIAISIAVGYGGCSGPPVETTPAEEPTPPRAADTAPGVESPGTWRAWGGPGGDFKVDAAGIAASWPADGPPVLWSRPLGAGYSAIAADAGRLFTMHRDGDEDVVIALDASDGRTLWEHRYTAPPRPENTTQFGVGPNASPLVLDDRIVTLGYAGSLRCLDRETGELLWSHDLIGDFDGDVLEFGYSASPILHDGKVIVLVGGKRQGVLAVDPADGSVAWSGKPTSASYATPIVIDVAGQEQLVYFTADEIVGLEAAGGAFLWSFPVVNQYRNNCTPPQWGDDGLLWVATQLDGGTRALRLTREGEATRVEEVWTSDRMSIHYWNTVRLGSHVYASIGSNGSILAGIDLATGEILWRQRGFEKVNFVQAGDLTVMLDAEGRLALARLAPVGIDILAETRIVDGPTWTAPTLVGTTLFVRDGETIRALALD